MPGPVLGDGEEETTDWWEMDRQTSRESMMPDQVLGHRLQSSFSAFTYAFHMHLWSTYFDPAT